MKFSVPSLLRASVFLLAAVCAFAFTESQTTNTPKFAVDSEERLYDLTGVNQGSGPNEYQCNASSQVCTWSDIELTQPMQINAQFVPGPGLQPID